MYRLIRLLLSEKGGLDDAYRLAADRIDRRTVADRIDDAIFQVTLSLMNQGRWSDARSLLKRACGRPHWQKEVEEGRCWYWLARIEAHLGDGSTASYEMVFHHYPYSWYGLLAPNEPALIS